MGDSSQSQQAPCQTSFRMRARLHLLTYSELGKPNTKSLGVAIDRVQNKLRVPESRQGDEARKLHDQLGISSAERVEVLQDWSAPTAQALFESGRHAA